MNAPTQPDRRATLWRDLKNPKAIWLKAMLFLGLGLMAATMLLFRRWDATDACLLLITVWAFCRAYYFAFYVIEHYVDSTYRFDGLVSFGCYLVRQIRRANR